MENKGGQRVYLFREGSGEGNTGMKTLLGGKGVIQAEMESIGLFVLPGLTIYTETCKEYLQNRRELPDGLWDEVLACLRYVEKEMGAYLGHPVQPLLLSFRSVATISIPGMMDTVLNLMLMKWSRDRL